MLVGRNEQCIVISEADKASLLKDPFATIVLGRLEADARPQSLDDVVKVIKGANEEGSFVFHSFLVGDGGQVSLHTYLRCSYISQLAHFGTSSSLSCMHCSCGLLLSSHIVYSSHT